MLVWPLPIRCFGRWHGHNQFAVVFGAELSDGSVLLRYKGFVRCVSGNTFEDALELLGIEHSSNPWKDVGPRMLSQPVSTQPATVVGSSEPAASPVSAVPPATVGDGDPAHAEE